ncbi:putative E3 ubiquitin-protein ligase HECTD4 isoform X3 [Tachypleus tridentatus]|uniref:putative E3 ubiquitin-protein ligase HECTD4 isoform X3 n=1 Tax=Tachypleus tridentatus TaxID=6853 RepID=UPI003FD51F2C
MSRSRLDQSQWLSLTEDSLFLQDGLLRITDLVELPHDINSLGDEGERDVEFVTVETDNLDDLNDRILRLCRTQNNAYTRLLEYRLNALRGLWTAQKQFAVDECERGNIGLEDAHFLLKKSSENQQEQASFSSRVSLLLVFPLLQSQSKTDPSLCGITANLLLNCLRECPPLSLMKEPADCLSGLENLLCSWLGEEGLSVDLDYAIVKDSIQRQNTAAALVALACARGSLQMMLHVIYLLQKMPELNSLPVADILQNLRQVRNLCTSSVIGSKHILSWPFEDRLTSKGDKNEQDVEGSRSITCDGKHLYMTSSNGQGLVKVGTGLYGTLRGFIYSRTADLNGGRVAWGNGLLLYRPYTLDKDLTLLALLINPFTLKQEMVVHLSNGYLEEKSMTTIQFTSDGSYFYLIWSPFVPIRQGTTQPIYMDIFNIKQHQDTLHVVPLKTKILLKKKEESSIKISSDTILPRQRPFRSTVVSAITLAALTGSVSSSVPSQETPGSTSNTSCGLSMKSLLRCPIFTCGTYIVILSASPSSSSSSAARSLFGSGTGLSSLRSLATNLVFSVEDGKFLSKTDLMDSPLCSLARGASLHQIGICYDVINNMIWTCSNDHVDQFFNSGHLATHHVNQKLGAQHVVVPPSLDNMSNSAEVICQLMLHVGSTCCHHLSCDISPNPALLNVAPHHQLSVNTSLLAQTLSILESTIHCGESHLVNCTLVVLQFIFKTFEFKGIDSMERELISRISSILWQLVKGTDAFSAAYGPQGWQGVQAEACRAIAFGLNILYPTVDDRNFIILQLLSEAEESSPLNYLCGLILTDFSEKLQNVSLNENISEQLRLPQDIIHVLMKKVVKDSCMLLRKCTTCHYTDFEIFISAAPEASECVRYLSAYQLHLLRLAVLMESESDKKYMKGYLSLKDIQFLIKRFANHLFTGAIEVLETLLEGCNTMIYKGSTTLEWPLQDLEKIVKGTILGLLLPVLTTSLTHCSFQSLDLADSLMAQLTQLVILTSQAALLLKSQVQAIEQEELLQPVTPDTDFVELFPESFPLENGHELEEREESGFLAGLKIPTPWATGRTVESVHPLRDNYKFRETVHISGARCLYLHFDPRCSSQYDYDKLSIYAGPNSSSTKVAEYGGNTLGYGSRSVLGNGWPSDFVKVDGDTVTFSFEMRSGREHTSPDSAMWGFLVTVRAQESAEEVTGGLPFLADLALGLSVVACTMLQLLYQGEPLSAEDEECKHLLQSTVLQRCVWQTASDGIFGPLATQTTPVPEIIDESTELVASSPTKLPRIRLTPERLQKLRETSGLSAPQLRPSIRDIIQTDKLEEMIVSAVIKHLSLDESVRQLKAEQENLRSLDQRLLAEAMKQTFRRIDALIRRLQVLAELEQRWQAEVEDIRKGLMPSHLSLFTMYHLLESQFKELAFLCYLKDVEYDPFNLEAVIIALREKMDNEAGTNYKEAELIKPMAKTQKLVKGIVERTQLLLNVTIANDETVEKGQSDSSLLICKHYSRSLSAPSELEASKDDMCLKNGHPAKEKRLSGYWKDKDFVLQNLLLEEGQVTKDQKPACSALLDQLFSFIGSHPEKSVSPQSFLMAAKVRHWRGKTRKQALIHMKELLTAASRVGGATHLVAAVAAVLQRGVRIDELACGGMMSSVSEAFGETLASVVQLVARYPLACCNSIGLLCIIPYTRAEEKSLVRSGLVNLLDRLLSLNGSRRDPGVSESQTAHQKVSALVWAGFQVLANRCIQWEKEEEAQDDLEHTGLARQVSALLSNHLTRATEGYHGQAVGNDALQEVLGLLNNLSKSRMGKAILSQPACISRLLLLLLDERPSPKLVMIILKLCHIALPLISAEECTKLLSLPSWFVADCDKLSPDVTDTPSRVASLFLTRLGDYIIPGCQLLSRQESQEVLSSDVFLVSVKDNGSQDRDRGLEDSDIQDGKLSVFLHKREDQSSHEVIQPLLSGTESRLFRFVGATNMERVVKMDREMSKFGKAEICTEEVASAIKRAAKWAQGGMVVSTGPPLDSLNTDSQQSSDKKKINTEVICRERNTELAKTDPLRPFISGQVANSMAAEVIGLLHSLLNSPESNTAELWAGAVEKVLTGALALLPQLLRQTETSNGLLSSNLSSVLSMSRQVLGALCVLGGFTESMKPGLHVVIVGEGLHNSCGQILSVSEQQGLATIQLKLPEDSTPYPRSSDIVQVPLSRLKTLKIKPFPLHRVSLTQQVVEALHALLVPENGFPSPLQSPVPIPTDGSSLAFTVCRAIAEIRTRACQVLAVLLKDQQFATAFMHKSCRAIDILKILAKECISGARLNALEKQCESYRMLYLDCAKPSPPPSKTTGRSKEMTWNPTRSFPPLRSSLFSHGMTSILFLGDPSVGSGLPRGTFVYASQPIPPQAPSFYWELEDYSFGDSQEDTGPVVSFGFAPAAEKKEGTWTNPVGTILFHNNGRVVHYNGSSLLQWRSVRLDVSLNPGDVAGCGWERQGEATELPAGQVPKGTVFFTHNGRRLSSTLDNVAGAMWPVVHIQKKNIRVRANFGTRPFAYKDGQQHKNAADECSENNHEIRANFGLLPFHSVSDSDTDIGERNSVGTGSSSESLQDGQTANGPPCKVPSLPKANKEYSTEASMDDKLPLSYTIMVTTGPESVLTGDISELEEVDDNQQGEDMNSLLVKAWESKVFPVIRRRFRNEAERKDGLEQIRGALQLGMTDIARQTVEFLYEENGGMPRDLHLPTVEDIREDLTKFTIDRIRKGAVVVVKNPITQASSPSLCTSEGVGISPGGSISGTHVPKFALPQMLKTFGLIGQVLEVDTQNELVQVETYLRNEGVLVRYWYPLEMLERPPQGLRQSAVTGSQTVDTPTIYHHRELVRIESLLTRMYCRAALMELIHHCNPEHTSNWSAPLWSTSTAASAAVLQELDVENLQLLSNELLAHNNPRGTVLESSLVTCQSLKQCLSLYSCSPSDLFYVQNKASRSRLQYELKSAISRAGKQGEDYLLELTNQICLCLQLAPESFLYEEVVISDARQTTDIFIPNAAFLVVSCRNDPCASSKKESSTYKSPWARVYSYSGPSIKKNGQLVKWEVVNYPLDADIGSSGLHSGSFTVSDVYPAVLIAGNKLHLKTGISPPPGMSLLVHGVPPELPLALQYIEVLLAEKRTELSIKQEQKYLITPTILLNVVELLGGYLWKSNIPALIKEVVFHLLAELLRILQESKTQSDDFSPFYPTLGSQLSPSLMLLIQLQAELKNLYEEETKNWTLASAASVTSMVLGTGDSGRFSSYFQALLEVCLAVAEVTSPITSGFTFGEGLSAIPTTSQVDLTSASGTLVPEVPISPLVSSRRKKLKPKRDREKTSSKGSVASKNSDPETGGPASSTQNDQGGSMDNMKPEDMLWFHRALTLSQILRHITYGDLHGASVTNDAIVDASQILQTPTSHTRLIVMTGIPSYLSQSQVKKAIRKALKTCGGAKKNEIFVPPVEKDSQTRPSGSQPSVNKTKNDSSSQASGNSGYAVVEILSQSKLETAKEILLNSKVLLSGIRGDIKLAAEDLMEISETMSVSTVTQSFQLSDLDDNTPLQLYFSSKFFPCSGCDDFSDAMLITLTEIFHSCFIAEHNVSLPNSRNDSGYICLNKNQITNSAQANLLRTFMDTLKGSKRDLVEFVSIILEKYGIPKLLDKDDLTEKEWWDDEIQKEKPISRKKKVLVEETESLSEHSVSGTTQKKPKACISKVDKSHKENDPNYELATEEYYLTLDGFIQFVYDQSKSDVCLVWQGLINCGYDLHFDRCACIDSSQAKQMAKYWTLDMDCALVLFVNGLSRKLAVAPSRIHPHEIHLSPAELASPEYYILQDVPVESIRLRFALLQSINYSLETFFLPLIDLRACNSSFSHSTAALLSMARGFIFYDTKNKLTNQVLNATRQRRLDQVAPEIFLDPLETIGVENKNVLDTQFCQAMRQLRGIPSGQLCVRLASGGDPTYAFTVKYMGEEVHGTSGSFRHFLSQVARELQGPLLALLMPCPSSALNHNKGRYILRPGNMSFSEEQLLTAFGQLLGITMRADIPLPLDLMPCFWKSLLGLPLDPLIDLPQADCLTYKYLKDLNTASSESELNHILEEHHKTCFVYTTLGAGEVELCPFGKNLFLSWENHEQYVELVKTLRMRELEARDRMEAIRAGLASIIPLTLLHLMSPQDIEMRICGVPEIDLEFLKSHTIYHVGLTETDVHVEYFWNALESLSIEELRKFVKFACNQDRIPSTCPCKDGQADAAHVPPYPMKIAPPDNRPGSPDSRFIRVETCMFMIKLPQYSSQEVMTEKLLYAIYCREDPLSG